MNIETDGYVHPTGGETTLYLIRHGQTMANSLSKYAGSWDVELNDVGHRQAEILAESLHEVPFDAATSSHLSRARDTAEAILRHHPNVPLDVDRDFAEWDFGELEGKDFARLVTDYPDLARQLRDPQASLVAWPGGESSVDFGQRVARGLDRLLTRYDHHRVAVITHGGVISTFMLCLIGRGSRKETGERPKFTVPVGEDYFRFAPSNCSISEVRVGPQLTTVVRWNDVQHLESEGIHRDPLASAAEAVRRRQGKGAEA